MQPFFSRVLAPRRWKPLSKPSYVLRSCLRFLCSDSYCKSSSVLDRSCFFYTVCMIRFPCGFPGINIFLLFVSSFVDSRTLFDKFAFCFYVSGKLMLRFLFNYTRFRFNADRPFAAPRALWLMPKKAQVPYGVKAKPSALRGFDTSRNRFALALATGASQDARRCTK